jgi:predicted ArsR family transcriptional regulator
MNEIIQYLKANGERLDAEIAEAVGMSLSKVRILLSELTAKGEVMSYQSTRFENGKTIEGIRCRIAGFIPKAAPGRKSKVQLKLS